MPIRLKKHSGWFHKMYSLMNIWTKELLRISPSVTGEWPELELPSLSDHDPLMVLGDFNDGPVFVSSAREQVDELVASRMTIACNGSSGLLALHPEVVTKDLRLVRMSGELVLSRPYRGQTAIPLR